MLDRTLFIDIETAPEKEHFEELSEAKQELWRKFKDRDGEMAYEELVDSYKEAGLKAEFGRIVCISVGVWQGDSIRTKSYVGSERDILTSLFSTLESYNVKRHFLCGHNIKEFDVPFVLRRALVHRITPPDFLVMHGKKPWELKHFYDTMEHWGQGVWKYRVSLALLCEIFNVPSPKSDIDGSQVGAAFYRGEIDRIARYCEADVTATIRLTQKLNHGD